MSGIAGLTSIEFALRIEHFRRSDIEDWETWLEAVQRKDNLESEFGRILRRWQACRPNTMRRTRGERRHEAPFLEDLLEQAQPHLYVLRTFDLRTLSCYTDQACHAIVGLWMVFADLSYDGRARGGMAGVVGISKAVLLLTLGRVGPAFDSQVCKQTGVGKMVDADDWLQALKWVTNDITGFEQANGCTLQEAAPIRFRHYHCGRLYDMALGPSAAASR
jgi:hypothetical protein